MKISAKGVLEIAEHEGIVLGPYKDSVGVWTYGVGHTVGAGEPKPAQMPKVDTRGWGDVRVRQELLEILKLFDRDLDRFEARVNQAIQVPLQQYEFDALVSFDFNTGGIHRAQLTKAINAGDKSGNGFMGWTKPRAIIRRREAEQAMFRTGNYDANGDAIPIYDALGDGRFRRRGSIPGAELHAFMLECGACHLPVAPPKLAPTVPAPSPSGSGVIAVVVGGAAATATGVVTFWERIVTWFGF